MKVRAVMKIAGTKPALGRLETRVRVSVAASNEMVANALLGMAKELVPVDTGALRDSGRVDQSGYGWDTRFHVGFGGNDPNAFVARQSKNRGGKVVKRYPFRYAFKVHQQHSTQREFLAIPLLQRRDELRQVLRDSASIAMKALSGGWTPAGGTP